MTDQQLEEKFREWFWEQYLTPPSVHAIRSHMAWARFLLEQVQEQQRREVQR